VARQLVVARRRAETATRPLAKTGYRRAAECGELAAAGNYTHLGTLRAANRLLALTGYPEAPRGELAAAADNTCLCAPGAAAYSARPG
jgi:hypothetical protein